MDGMDWIHLARITKSGEIFVNMVLNVRVIQNAGNFLDNLTKHWLLKKHVTLWSY
jgi:hypothetical protein